MTKISDLKPPIAKKIPHQLEKHGDVRVDNYFWMKDREHPEVIDYLNAENAYCDGKMAHTKAFQKDLFEEMKARIKEDDSSVPYKYNGYWYITKFEKGKDYPIYTRKKESLDNPEELLFDCNKMAEGESYFKLAGISISPDNKKVSYGIDKTGRRNYTIHVKDLTTNKVADDRIEGTTGSSSWANDNATLFYTKKDEVTLRAFQIFKHRLGDTSKDKLVFEEGDDTFGAAVYKSKSRKYIIIACYSTLTNEYHILDADNPEGEFQVFQPRIRGLEYSISHYNDHFYITTNKDKATNFKLMKTLITNTTVENWTEVIAHRNDVLLEGIDIFKDYLVVSERKNGLNEIRIKRWDNTEDYYLPFNNETYTAYTGTNVDFDTELLRYGYNAMTTPSSVIEFNMRTKTKTVLKEQQVLDKNFDKDNYVSERIWATAEDGTKIPMSIVYKKGIKKDGTNPLLQYAYGSYGSTVDPYFSTIRLTLLDRGFIYVITHIRGGEYLGRDWYENGKLLNKKNTFSDFIACSVHLIKERYTSSKHLYAMGGSAGGLLMGAIINKAPELYNGVIAAVPFVDVITTMLDDSIPLTTGEYDEWGNPNDVLYYNYIKSYSPYDNVEAKAYPNMLVTTGLHDSQVQYWEPAKWVAKLRDMKTDNNQLYLKTNMDAGHGGASGRFESLKEDAEEFAFLLDLEGITN
ncbi:S9 family peptidase [Winogradskyella endarachnes]|uniref:Proline-specific endopeptidase n=1 Tax=Winogradskyella endarachnes TaxID=2681965 RepID=A0A6L6U8T5_9FLAO|nr:S9 family peptidase [Winogradskyella endarachnes]MUU77327.1 prolyl oligopeptidase family serine peptidase [Winogradskyella endarachnes]